MSNFSKNQNHGYVVVDFDNVNERGFKKLIKALKVSGPDVVDLQASNRPTRKDGQSVKSAKFFFENGQSMTLFIGSQGDIYQMTLNATKQPIPSVKNERELAKEMQRLMERNQKKFDRQQARKAKKVIKDTSASKPLSRALSTRLKEAQTTLADVKQNHSSVSSALSTATTQLASLDSELETLKSQLSTELEETKALEAQLEGAN